MITATENNTPTENENEPISSRVRPAVALLWPCPKCVNHLFNVTKHFDATVTANFRYGSKRAPLKGTCEHCGKMTRLRSEDHNHVKAEVNWRRVRERFNLISLAEMYNYLGERPSLKQMYDLYNSLVGYKGKKPVPQPFKRWDDRGV